MAPTAKSMLDKTTYHSTLIGEPSPCSSEIERPSEARPSKIPEEHIEKPTPAGRVPSALAA
jgi:hypothetical protein